MYITVTPWFTPPYAVVHRAKNLYTLKPKGVQVLSPVYHTVWRGKPRCDDFISDLLHFKSYDSFGTFIGAED